MEEFPAQEEGTKLGCRELGAWIAPGEVEVWPWGTAATKTHLGASETSSKPIPKADEREGRFRGEFFCGLCSNTSLQTLQNPKG